MSEWSTTDTRDLVAATIATHVDRVEPHPDGGRGHAVLECSCDCWTADLPADADWDPPHDLFRAHRADAVLTALTEAGALLPAGSEMVERYGVKAPDGVIWADPLTKAEAWQSVLRQGADARLLARCVYYGPWREVPDA